MIQLRLPVAFSFCPNDTFLFHAWVHSYVGEELPLNASLGDIQSLNEWATQSSFPLIKISLSHLPSIIKNYQLLPVGNALGYHCGPKIIAKQPFSIEDLQNKIIAIPGKSTTAHTIYNQLLPQPQQKLFCTYHEVFPLIHSGKADCGLIIHESRFTYIQEGFYEIADLGSLWHQRFNLPLPLGGLAIRRGYKNASLIVKNLQDSLMFAKAHPEVSRDYISTHSQEKDENVIRQHIQLYVNEETYFLSQTGIKAIEQLINLKENTWLFS